MNISSNLGSAVGAASAKGAQKAPGKSAAPADAEPLSNRESADSAADSVAERALVSGNSDFVERVEFGPRAFQDGQGASGPVLSASEADSTVVYLKSVILALPALVLRAQANPVQESGLKLLS